MQIFLKTYPRSDTACNAQNSTFRKSLIEPNPYPDGNHHVQDNFDKASIDHTLSNQNR